MIANVCHHLDESARTARGPSKTHPQKGTEEHRTFVATPNRAAATPTVSFYFLLRMDWHFGRESNTKIMLTTDFTDERKPDSAIRPISVIRGSGLRGPKPSWLRTQNRLVGRKSDDHRTQNAARRYRPKLCRLFEIGSNTKTFGRIGRKFPEHFIEEEARLTRARSPRDWQHRDQRPHAQRRHARALPRPTADSRSRRVNRVRNR